MNCPICRMASAAATPMRRFVTLPGVPVHCNIMHDDAETARRAPRGDIDLAICETCSFVHNVAFDEGLLDYGEDYDASLEFSPRFRSYADELANRLLDQYGKQGLDILEVGCGNGEFLRRLTAGGANQCVGFDRSYQATAVDQAPLPGLTIHSEFFAADEHVDVRADLLLMRHVLEHVADPVGFVAAMIGGLRDRDAATLYCEVPNGLWTLQDLGIWDLIYEHCSYFTPTALMTAIRGAGLHPQRCDIGYGGQFLSVEASRGGVPGEDSQLGVTHRLADVLQLASDFGAHFAAKVELWAARLDDCEKAGRSVVIWGAGSKGVSFLNALPNGELVGSAIDVNPHKAGRFMPGTGQPIHPPEWLVSNQPEVVLVMNPIYQAEIDDKLGQLGVMAETLTV